MRAKGKYSWLIRGAAVFLVFSFLSTGFGQESPPEVKGKEVTAKEAPDKVVPSPKDIKEGTAIYVFVAWMWLAIVVLIYILRLKIRESDRLYEIKFLSPDKK